MLNVLAVCAWMMFVQVIIEVSRGKDIRQLAERRHWDVMKDLADKRNLWTCRRLAAELEIDMEPSEDAGEFIQWAAQQAIDKREREYLASRLSALSPPERDK